MRASLVAHDGPCVCEGYSRVRRSEGAVPRRDLHRVVSLFNPVTVSLRPGSRLDMLQVNLIMARAWTLLDLKPDLGSCPNNGAVVASILCHFLAHSVVEGRGCFLFQFL